MEYTHKGKRLEPPCDDFCCCGPVGACCVGGWEGGIRACQTLDCTVERQQGCPRTKICCVRRDARRRRRVVLQACLVQSMHGSSPHHPLHICPTIGQKQGATRDSFMCTSTNPSLLPLSMGMLYRGWLERTAHRVIQARRKVNLPGVTGEPDELGIGTYTLPSAYNSQS